MCLHLLSTDPVFGELVCSQIPVDGISNGCSWALKVAGIYKWRVISLVRYPFI